MEVRGEFKSDKKTYQAPEPVPKSRTIFEIRTKRLAVAENTCLCGAGQTGEPLLLDRHSFCLKRRIVVAGDEHLNAGQK